MTLKYANLNSFRSVAVNFQSQILFYSYYLIELFVNDKVDYHK